MRYAWRLVAACVVAGCGPVVDAPAETDGGDGDASRTGPMGDASTPATSAAPTDDGSSVPGDPTDARFDVSAGGGTTTGGYDPCDDDLDVGPLPTAVMMLLDASQTMTTMTLDHDGDPDTSEVSRWSMVVSTLSDHLPQLVAVAEVGVQAFPSFDVAAVPSADACRAEDDGLLPPADADELLDYLPPQDASFVGATPTAAVLDIAHAAFGSSDAGADRRILLLTDSAPNCGVGPPPPELFTEPDAAATALAEALREEGISTHVVGIDVDEGTFGGGPEGEASTDHRARLDELATAGGEPLLLVDDAAAFDLALAGFVEEATSCRLRIPPELADSSELLVRLGDSPTYVYWLEDADCAAGLTGYRYLETSAPGTLELCGDACTTFRELGFATLRAFCGVVE